MVEKALKGFDGVRGAQVNLSTEEVSTDYECAQTSVGDLVKAIRSAGYTPGTAEIRLAEHPTFAVLAERNKEAR